MRGATTHRKAAKAACKAAVVESPPTALKVMDKLPADVMQSMHASFAGAGVRPTAERTSTKGIEFGRHDQDDGTAAGAPTPGHGAAREHRRLGGAFDDGIPLFCEGEDHRGAR